MINKKVWVENNGLMELYFMASTYEEKRLAKAALNGQTEANMMVISKTIP